MLALNDVPAIEVTDLARQHAVDEPRDEDHLGEWQRRKLDADVVQQTLPPHASEGEGEHIAGDSDGVEADVHAPNLYDQLGGVDVDETKERDEDGDADDKAQRRTDVEEARSKIDLRFGCLIH